MRDLIAERQVLAIALTGPAEIQAQFAAMPPGVFGQHDEQGGANLNDLVATVLRDRIRRGIPIDPAVLAADAARVAGSDDKARRVGMFVAELASTFPPAVSWSYYAERVLLLHAAREASVHAYRLAQRLETADEPADVVELVRTAANDLNATMDGLIGSASEPPLSLAEMLDGPEEPHDWLVPNLWERMDRVVITGFEGTGKSYLLAQFALAIAAGVHPFRAEVIKPHGHRVLILDMENSRRQIRRRYAIIRRQVDRIRESAALSPMDWSTAVRFYHRPEGIDLSNPSEVARAERAIAATAPDLVLAGPLYRMHRLNLNDEPAAREIVEVLDRWRVKYGFTLIVEAHVGHVGESSGGRKLRPTGSSLFMRWPEFGYGIRAFGDGAAEEHPSVVEVVAWRGSRDERDWPKILRHGESLPWVPSDPEYERRHLSVVS